MNIPLAQRYTEKVRSRNVSRRRREYDEQAHDNVTAGDGSGR